MINLEERISEKKSFFNRLIIVYIFFAGLFLYFLYKTFLLQISSYTDYEIASLENKTREVLIQPRRGVIYDRNGNILVNNVPSFNLIINPSSIENIDDHLNEINQIINLTEDEENYAKENFSRLAKLNRELVLKKNLSTDERSRFKVRKYKFPNTFIDQRYSRENLYPFLFSHSLGYTGSPEESDLEEIFLNQNLKPKEMIFSYSNGYLIGKTGLEYTYDDFIRGRFGKKIFEVDASGKFLNELRVVDAINGKDLFTSLDLESQKVAYEQLNRRRGAVVAVDINTGAIVTYLSSPSFSVNKIANGMTQKEFKLLINDDDKPFFDRAAQGRYSPASTIKPAIALFGIENNIIDWDFTLDDPGYFILPEDGRIYRGWKKGGHGNINLNDAIIESSNTFFFSLAYKSEIEDLTKHLSNFGFGEIVCLDCFLPDSGLLPNPSWKMNNLNFGWFKGDTVNLGVGQGYMSATPIQLAYYASFLANKGELNKFSFVQDNDNKEVKKNIFLNNNIDESDWLKLHESMIGVIENPKGTAGRLRALKDYTIAAKSGTVELVSTETKEDYKIIREIEGQRDHAIIIAFGPMPNPKYAVSVVIENGESGGSVAGPVAIEVLNALLKK